MTSTGPAIIEGGKRFSGGGNPRHSLINCGYGLKKYQLTARANKEPIPTPINMRPVWGIVRPRFSPKISGYASNTVLYVSIFFPHMTGPCDSRP